MSETTQQRTPFLLRMWRAAMLHADTYEEIEADRSALGPAFAVVLMVSASAALGTWIRIQTGAVLPDNVLPLPLHLLIIVLEPIIIWLVSAVFTYMVGATFLRGPETKTDYAEVLRTTGFAFSPGLLLFATWIPPEELGLAVFAGAWLWILVAAVIAVRQALDFNTLRAIGTYCVATALMWLLLWGLSIAPIPAL